MAWPPITLAAVLLPSTIGSVPRPNFVIMLTDDLGWNSAWHNSEHKTPTLDVLVKDSMELDRHYVYRYCAPTRASFLTGRYPFRLSATRANLIPSTLLDGINTSYTYLPKKLKEAGYISHHIGKWHNGFYEYAMTPPGRGFDSSLGFLTGGEDHWTSRIRAGPCEAVDLSFGWSHNQTVAPATRLNGSYTGFTFSDRAVELIRGHPTDRPLFLYVALHNTHAPIESPPAFSALYDYNQTKRNEYYGQVSFVDESVKNVTTALKATGMWTSTLFIWTTDNGSPVNSAGSNEPFRGGKGSFWDGGYRVPGFVGGGLLPESKRGTRHPGLIHISDWWPTFASMAGLSAGDDSGPTPVDGVDQSVAILDSAPAPRSEAVLDHLMHCVPGLGYDPTQCVRGQTPDFPAGHYPNHTAGVLLWVKGDKLYKLIVGPAQQATWYGKWPLNSTHKLPPYSAFVRCWPKPCLYELSADPTEHVDLSESGTPSDFRVRQAMLTRFKDLEHGYHPNKANPSSDDQGVCGAVARNGGFLRPWK